jgi:hypothetical protein
MKKQDKSITSHGKQPTIIESKLENLRIEAHQPSDKASTITSDKPKPDSHNLLTWPGHQIQESNPGSQSDP